MNDKKYEELKTRIEALEHFVIVVLSLLISFMLGVTEIFRIEWYPKPLILSVVQNFLIAFSIFYFFRFSLQAINKLGNGIISIVKEFQRLSSLNKTLTALTFFGSIYGIIELIGWIIKKLI